MSESDEDLVFSKLATGLGPVQSEDTVRQRVLETVLQRIKPPPAGGTTVRRHETSWQEITDRIRLKVLHIDEANDIQTTLWQLDPGGVIPGHAHRKDEECLVLEGTFHIGEHVLHQGDFHVMSAGSEHPELHSPDGCLLYIRQAVTNDLSWMSGAKGQ